MTKVALNFICKNEKHVIVEMLESVMPVTDLIVAVDTGSTDDTVSLIRKFGYQNNVPVYVFERPFDNFCESRNFALEKLRSTVISLGWNLETTWGFRMDCDEKMQITDAFEKSILQSDICLVPLNFKGYARDRKTLRQHFFRLSKDIIWEGAVHEILTYREDNVTTSELNGIAIIRKPIGASWKNNLERKYLKYAGMLEQYVTNGHWSFKWLNYLAETYVEAGFNCKVLERRKAYFRKAQEYFEKMTQLDLQRRKDRYGLYQSIALNKERLYCENHEIREAFLLAYTMDKRHAEPLFMIVNNCIKLREWEVGYLFSSFCNSDYHGRVPQGKDLEKIEKDIYEWKFLVCHCFICLHTERFPEGLLALQKLRSFLYLNKKELAYREILTIRKNIMILNLGVFKYKLSKIGYKFLLSPRA